ncbi:hypothetical protein H6F67_25100 [Microcoleus sp. FACHB-1515]|uniref:hypothetical protein n=1 Tax=Cyanophyceae TaxID=3028117 RepID=UPI001682C36B|nr:hypothetical protein [Microcoleus sp. FACHB-1515]MBD2093126.1 hypothetical protein [Microcoleus sp. FACHB-1515]
MTPKFADAIAWQQAEILMQPVFIRIIDNLRKQLEQTTWKGTYHDTQTWPDGVTDDIKAQVLDLHQQLIRASDDHEIAEIEHTLAQLPRFQPGYELWLEPGDTVPQASDTIPEAQSDTVPQASDTVPGAQSDRQIKLDLWQLCYQVCFRDYHPGTPDDLIAVDTDLLDEDGEVDWFLLDQKAKHLIEQTFRQLPQ